MLIVSFKHEAAHRYVLNKTLFGQFLAISGPILQGLYSMLKCSKIKLKIKVGDKIASILVKSTQYKKLVPKALRFTY